MSSPRTQKRGRTVSDRSNLAAMDMKIPDAANHHWLPTSRGGKSKSGGSSEKRGSIHPTKMHGSR